MSVMQTVADEHRDRILDTMVENTGFALISYHSLRGWRSYKCRFHSLANGDDEIRLVMETLSIADAGSPKPGETVGVSFRMGHKKCMFSAVLREVDRGVDTTVRLRCIGPLRQLQRRAYDRATPPRNVVVPVRFWQEAASAQSRGNDRDTRHGQLENISAGGMRIQTRTFHESVSGATYRCILTPQPGAPTLIIDAVLRNHDAVANERVSLGFQFVGLEATSEGQELLGSIVQIVNRFKHVRARGDHHSSRSA